MGNCLFRIAVVLALIFCAAFAGAEEPSAPRSHLLRVLSLNFNAEMVPNDIDSRLRDGRFRALLDWVGVNHPDVILLQEGWNYHGDPSVAITLARALHWDMDYRLDMGAPGFLYDSVAILAKKSLHLSEVQAIELPHSAHSIGDGKNWVLVTGAVSYGVGGRITLADGESAYLYTTHLVGDTDSDKRDQMLALNSAIQAQVEKNGGVWGTTKVITGGDLNSPPGSLLDQAIRSAGYTDAWEVNHPTDPGFTDCANVTDACFNPMELGGYLFPDQAGENSSGRIDHLYALGRGISPLASTIVFNLPINGVWMSDHYGLLTTYNTGGPASPVSNPARDFGGFILPTHIQDIRAQNFYCGGPSIGRSCHNSLAPYYVVGPKGLTIHNVKGAGLLDVRIDGPGIVYPYNRAQLDSNQRASFVFAKDGDYTYQVKDPWGNRVTGVVHVIAEKFSDNRPIPVQQ
ncbi:MAG: endonuclease/exonuclease/phosphatase family protein [Deltaproteobacteria bacterium]|nr:endonuclease/exonuclease/phosphatase family protein [Deltaproteobacteria bacterium]